MPIVVENFNCADIFVFELQRYNFSRKFQFCLSHCPSRNVISPEVFYELPKTLYWLIEKEGGYFGWKFQVRRYFRFAVATLKLFQHPENVKFQFLNLPIPRWNAISPEVFYEFFKPFFWLKEVEPSYCGWKFRVRRYFGFAIATLQLFQNPLKGKYFNFAFHTVAAEMLYLQKYYTKFLKLFFGWKKRKVAIVVENFKCKDILVLQ